MDYLRSIISLTLHANCGLAMAALTVFNCGWLCCEPSHSWTHCGGTVPVSDMFLWQRAKEAEMNHESSFKISVTFAHIYWPKRAGKYLPLEEGTKSQGNRQRGEEREQHACNTVSDKCCVAGSSL